MRVFIAAMVGSIGIALYATAALVWDRRRQLVELIPAGRGSVRAAGQAGPGVAGAGTQRRLVPLAVVLGSVLLGTLLIFGSCIGVFTF